MLKLAEHFHSLQGEGYWVGTPMHFIRLAGCSVGKPQSGLPYYDQGDNIDTILSTGAKAWRCHTWDSRSFWCDTDFNKHEELSAESLVDETWEEHVCLTGGEPMMPTHRSSIESLRMLLNQKKKWLHIETSGTTDLPAWCTDIAFRLWITCSPKEHVQEHWLRRADEIKLLVSTDFNPSSIPKTIITHPRVYLSPINPPTGSVHDPTLLETLELLKNYPNWRLSVQLHKYLGLR